MAVLRFRLNRAPTLATLWHYGSRIACALCGGLFLYVAVAQIFYPGFTEPMEGDILQHIERAAHGLPLYPRPSGDFIALTYLPFYYFTAVPFYLLCGDSLAGPRLLSALCAFGAAYLVWRIAWHESQDRATAYFAAALFFGSYRVMDAYLFCGLPDALLLWWLLAGWYWLGYGTRRTHDALAILCFACAFWTKQQGALFFGCAVLYALVLRRAPSIETVTRLPRWVWLLGLIVGGPLVYGLVGPHLGVGFVYHTLAVPAKWPHSYAEAATRTGFILFCAVPCAVVLAALYLWPQSFAKPQSWREVLAQGWTKLQNPVVWLTLSALAVGTFTMSSVGSSNNHYIPFIAGLTIIAALGARRLLVEELPKHFSKLLGAWCLAAVLAQGWAMRHAGEHNTPLFAPLAMLGVYVSYLLVVRSVWAPLSVSALAAILLLCGQLAVGAYHPTAYLPVAGYRQEVAQLRAELRSLDAPVVWATYGNAPQLLTERKLERMPSWIAADDIRRREVPPADIVHDMRPWQDYVNSYPQLYVLSDRPLEKTPNWKEIAHEFELVRDYGEKYSGLRQIAVHWYGGGNFPHYLYQRRTPNALARQP